MKQYRDLRAQFYGRSSYDFGEDSIVLVAERLANARPAVAIALMAMNLEFAILLPRLCLRQDDVAAGRFRMAL